MAEPEDQPDVPISLRKDGKVQIGDAVFTADNLRTLNVINNLISGEQTVDLQLTLTRPIPKQED